MRLKNVVESRIAGEHRTGGRSVPRIDVLDKVLDKAQFTADLQGLFPGLLFGKVLHSFHTHAWIKNLDTNAVRKIPGVLTVITGKDCPRLRSRAGTANSGLDEVT